MQLDTSTLAQLQKKFRLSLKDFDDIKQNAKVMWTNIVPKPTTYNTYFSGGEITELTPIRPTSRNRRNNPHPPEIFLTNGLHKIEAYKDSVEGKQIEVEKLKYGKNHDPSLRKSYQDLNQFKEILPPYEAHATNSWVKLADECDQKKVLDVINDRERRYWENNKVKMCSKTASPSLYRWMRISGIKGKPNPFFLDTFFYVPHGIHKKIIDKQIIS
ncbi:hypothetical protein Bpfe_022721 [Biomphalaria pfeifferi]|uniref:Uncharacterized protein n=1 Tax=Biomphalaria pfeifferi TaxID=112525 RepID=A0AAD8B5A0_BIOPF|nr:hypothetical protein Bpfe_022721 [Biomphalaria pfeifferi]